MRFLKLIVVNVKDFTSVSLGWGWLSSLMSTYISLMLPLFVPPISLCATKSSPCFSPHVSSHLLPSYLRLLSLLSFLFINPVFVNNCHQHESKSCVSVSTQVAATDRDSGSFGEVTYSIKSPSVAQETFKIDSNG